MKSYRITSFGSAWRGTPPTMEEVGYAPMPAVLALKPCCLTRVGHRSTCPIFLHNQPLSRTLNRHDYIFLSKDSLIIELITHTPVSPKVAAECRAELAAAQRNKWRT